MHSLITRFFIGVELELSVVERLLELQRDLNEKIETLGARFVSVKPEVMVFNLKSLGEKDPRQFFEILPYLSQLCGKHLSFQVRSGGLGVFPSFSKPRFVYVQCKEGEQMLRHLYSSLEEGLTNFGYECDSRVFVPHVSLGRVKTLESGLDLSRVFESYQGYDFGASHIREIVIFQGQLMHWGVRYSVISRHSLGV